MRPLAAGIRQPRSRTVTLPGLLARAPGSCFAGGLQQADLVSSNSLDLNIASTTATRHTATPPHRRSFDSGPSPLATHKRSEDIFREDTRLFEGTRVQPTTTLNHATTLYHAPLIVEAFRLMDLPGEQRNEVYRMLFDDITTPDREFQVWASDAPKYDGKLTAYSALVRTCKTVFQEASTIWQAEYLPNLTLYFLNPTTLFNVCGPDASTELKKTGVKFLLRNAVVPCVTGLRGTDFIAEMTSGDIMQSLVLENFSRIFLDLGEAAQYLKSHGPVPSAGKFADVVVDGSLKYRTLEHPQVPGYAQLKMFSRNRSPDPMRQHYTETIGGRVRDLTWDNWRVIVEGRIDATPEKLEEDWDIWASWQGPVSKWPKILDEKFEQSQSFWDAVGPEHPIS